MTGFIKQQTTVVHWFVCVIFSVNVSIIGATQKDYNNFNSDEGPWSNCFRNAACHIDSCNAKDAS